MHGALNIPSRYSDALNIPSRCSKTAARNGFESNVSAAAPRRTTPRNRVNHCYAELAVFEEVSGDDNSQALSSDEDAEVIRPSKSSQIIPPQTDRLSRPEHQDD